jgi:hypothetical protein
LTPFTESTVEQAALNWLARNGWSVLHGNEIAPGARQSDACVADERCLNPCVPGAAR